MITGRTLEAIEASDTDELLRAIDGLCAAREWDDLVDLAGRCLEAVARGKQLWAIEEHIRYRLALEAPPQWAGPAVGESDQVRFTVGPLPEVVASTKTWREIEPHLPEGPWRGVTAAECVVRGETVDDLDGDLPGWLLDWEPAYQLATYKPDKVETPAPRIPPLRGADLPAGFTRIEDTQSEEALYDLVAPWVTESNGRCDTATVEGSALDAVRALGLTRARVAEIDLGEAMRWMAWAGASGGAHGRRRGAAAGRYGTWWALTAICDLDWPPDPEAVAAGASRLRYRWFDDGAPGTGWHLRLALEDPQSGLAWAVSAVDSAE